MATAPYLVKGNTVTDGAETSSENPAAGNIEMRILTEMMVQTYLLALSVGFDEDLQEFRQTVADSIT
jgi:hypothetical protein